MLYHYSLLTATLNTLGAFWVTVQAKYSVRNAPASSALTQVLHQSMLQIVTYTVKEEGMEHKGE